MVVAQMHPGRLPTKAISCHKHTHKTCCQNHWLSASLHWKGSLLEIKWFYWGKQWIILNHLWERDSESGEWKELAQSSPRLWLNFKCKWAGYSVKSYIICRLNDFKVFVLLHLGLHFEMMTIQTVLYTELWLQADSSCSICSDVEKNS